jgi:type IX secretion system PorP/SprF family membrane protein
MKRSILCLSLAFFFLNGINIQGQDFQYSQPFAVPLYLNPAFTGNGIMDCDNSRKWYQKENFRFACQHRNQWLSGTNGNYSSSLAAFDYSWGRIGRKKTGNLNWSFGGFVQNDFLSRARLNSLFAGLTISVDVPLLDDNRSLKFGYQLAGGSRSIAKPNFDWGDEFNGSGFNLNTTDEIPAEGNSRLYGDIASVGGLYGTKNFFIGAAWHHIARPNISMWNGSDRLREKLSVHGGLILSPRMSWFGRPSRHKSRIFIVSSFKQQAGFQQWDFGAYLQHTQKSWKGGNVMVGTWYRGIPVKKAPDAFVQNDAMVASFGLKFNTLTIFYSYDFPISRSAVFGKSMEISLAYQYTSTGCRTRSGLLKRTIVCPDGGSGLQPWKN